MPSPTFAIGLEDEMFQAPLVTPVNTSLLILFFLLKQNNTFHECLVPVWMYLLFIKSFF